MNRRIHTCELCNKRFTEKSNLTRHMKIHFPKEIHCDVCGKDFTTKPHLQLHLEQHQYPRIPLYRQGEVQLQRTAAAKAVADKCKVKKQESKPEASVSQFQHVNYASDAELLAAAESMLGLSELSVTSQITTVGELTPAACQDSDNRPGTSAQQETFVSAGIQLEGWQKYWEEPPPSSQALGIAPPNISWLKYSETYGLFEKASKYQNARGEIVERKLLKDQMEFHPPPPPMYVNGAVPNMLAFFTTPAFFWRPVGVMKALIRCPNTNCPAPPGEYLQKKGFATYARQVCGMRYNYTLLTEKLKCPHCERIRQASATRESEDEEEEDDSQHQYMWLAYSPMILMQLAPAIRSMFPAILCGRHAIDKGVVTLLNDRLNSISMSKVQRLLKQGHDEWYMERRDLYQTLLYEAHTAGCSASASASSSSSSSQRTILSFVKAAGMYTPPIPQSPLPSAPVLRRAHLIMEMEKMDVYRNQILSVTGEILCIDGTRKVLKKIYGDGQGTMQYITSVLNEWGQILTTVVVAAESEECYKRMARALMARFQRVKAPAPKVIYADNYCCRDKGSSFLENLFSDWVQRGTVVRLDIRHWLHCWDAVIIKQSHAKYAAFMSAMAGAVLAYNIEDMMLLVQAVRSGNRDLFTKYKDEEMIPFLKSHQIRSYVRRITRGVEETASAIESILDEFKGPAGLDIDGIHLFKSTEAVDSHWATASRHLGCMQDPPGIALYVAVKTVLLNRVQVTKYRCRRGSNSLVGLHAHLYSAIPSQRCGIIPFQVYLISFAVQWNTRMESLRVAGGQDRQTTCMDPRQIQGMNQQAEVLFDKDHILEQNVSAPLPYPELYGNPDEEELLGVEYAMCQSTAFAPRQFYAKKAEEEQSHEVEEEEESAGTAAGETGEVEEEMSDEGLCMSDEDPIDSISATHAVLTKAEQVEEEDSPALQDVLMTKRHLRLPGVEEVEALALLLLELADSDDNHHLVPVNLRHKIVKAVGSLQDHDKSAASFVETYQSRWGYTLCGRCLGADTHESSSAEKTTFSWMPYAQAAQVTQDSRLIYFLIKMIKNCPPANRFTSPSKVTTSIKAQYKRIADRVRDDPILRSLSIPLPNINSKSISNFLVREEKMANYRATVLPKAKPHRTALSQQALPEAPAVPSSLPPPERSEVQYEQPRHVSGKRRGEKRRLDFEEPQPGPGPREPAEPKPPAAASYVTPAPILLLVPAQPQAPSIQLTGPSYTQVFVPVNPPTKAAVRPIMPNNLRRPCAACKVPQCGGNRKRYTPSKDKVSGSSQKLFTFCPATNKSITPGFEGVYDNYEHFKSVVDKELKKRKKTDV